jgi:mannose-6-phosphate isomerase
MLRAPLAFRPVYQSLVWGGRRLASWRSLPDGPVGESWELADHERAMSVVADGPLAGRTLRDLTVEAGEDLVGRGFRGRPFPLLVKLIDAADRLSVQVHPDDQMARQRGLGDNGKTECWVILAEGGSLYQGLRPGIDRAGFERALAERQLADVLNCYEGAVGDAFFIEARTVHALGAGSFVYEVQQTSDVTFRVYDWDRVGLDGRPRPLHVAESLATIDFGRTGFGPLRPAWRSLPEGVQARVLVDCPYFTLDELRIPAGASLSLSGMPACAAVTCVAGQGSIETAAGALALSAMHTALIPAAAASWRATASARLDLLVATPRP